MDKFQLKAQAKRIVGETLKEKILGNLERYAYSKASQETTAKTLHVEWTFLCSEIERLFRIAAEEAIKRVERD